MIEFAERFEGSLALAVRVLWDVLVGYKPNGAERRNHRRLDSGDRRAAARIERGIVGKLQRIDDRQPDRVGLQEFDLAQHHRIVVESAYRSSRRSSQAGRRPCSYRGRSEVDGGIERFGYQQIDNAEHECGKHGHGDDPPLALGDRQQIVDINRQASGRLFGPALLWRDFELGVV